MGLAVEPLGDVTRLRMTSAGSRAVGMDVSAYVLRGVMIDSGFHRVRRALAQAIADLRVGGVVVTHWHEDHAGNVAMLAERGVPISLRDDTHAILTERPAIQVYRRVVWGHPPALVAPITVFDAGGMTTLHTPGHSIDHQVVWDAETRTLFSGDLWLGVRARIVHATEDPYQIIESLHRVLALEPRRMFDAHRGPVENPVAAINAKIDWLSETLETIRRRIHAGDSDAAILREVLGGEELAAYVSRGDYARRNLIKAVRARA